MVGIILLCHHANTAEAVTAAEESWLTAEIEAAIEKNRILVAKYVRLSFHDCVDGCNGCVDMDNLDNAGLNFPIASLDAIIKKPDAPVGISRADLWALAGLVGARRAARLAGNRKVKFTFRWGRTDCADPSNTAEELPMSSDGTIEVFDFFSEKFGFDQYETVVLLGAHTLGGASQSSSGFMGTWTSNTTTLDNDYYRELVKPWRQISVVVNDVDCDRLGLRLIYNCEVRQWRRGGAGGGRALLQNGGPGGGGGGGGGQNTFVANFMLNADIAMVRTIDPDDTTGLVVERFGSLPNAPTLKTVEKFAKANKNQKWQGEFEKVFVRMVEACILASTNSPCTLKAVVK